MPRGEHGNHARGLKHPRWNAGQKRSSHGYVKVRVGVEHPLADGNGYAYEHTLVWAAAGYVVRPGYVLHHLNHDKADNRLDNLACMPRGSHNAHHNIDQHRDKTGRFIGKRRAEVSA